MTEGDIMEIIGRFTNAAVLAERARFSGVQIHAAHGYLLSQFLSPLTNRRTDQWGGSLENRARLLVRIVESVRSAVSPEFCVAVKLNSADFQRGGFDVSDARKVVEMSSGSYEAPAMQGDSRDGRTLAREAYFMEFAQQMVDDAKMPLMVTGGICCREVAEKVIASGVAVAGIASALAIDPNLPKRWKSGEDAVARLRPITWSLKALAERAYMASIKFQMRAITLDQVTNPKVSPLRALIIEHLDVRKRTRDYRKWMAGPQ